MEKIKFCIKLKVWSAVGWSNIPCAARSLPEKLWRKFVHSALNTSISPLRILAKWPKTEEASIDSNHTIKYF